MKTIEEIKKSGRIAIDDQSADGFSGVRQFPHWAGTLVCSWGAGWEHVSVAPFRRNYTPTWDDMCFLKNIFWHEEEAAIQIHPPKSEYVNNLSNCLHLWRCTYREMVLPPACLVGIKDGQTKGELLDEIDKAYRLAETYKDPLEAFAGMLEDYEDPDHRKVKDLAQFLNYYRGGAKAEEIAKRPTPKMVIYESDGYADGAPVYDMAICPVCEHRFEDYESAWGEPFCPHCGQALKWDNEEKGAKDEDNNQI